MPILSRKYCRPLLKVWRGSVFVTKSQSLGVCGMRRGRQGPSPNQASCWLPVFIGACSLGQCYAARLACLFLQEVTAYFYSAVDRSVPCSCRDKLPSARRGSVDGSLTGKDGVIRLLDWRVFGVSRGKFGLCLEVYGSGWLVVNVSSPSANAACQISFLLLDPFLSVPRKRHVKSKSNKKRTGRDEKRKREGEGKGKKRKISSFKLVNVVPGPRRREWQMMPSGGVVHGLTGGAGRSGCRSSKSTWAHGATGAMSMANQRSLCNLFATAKTPKHSLAMVSWVARFSAQGSRVTSLHWLLPQRHSS